MTTGSRFRRLPEQAGSPIDVTLNGARVSAVSGDTVAALLLAHSAVPTRFSPVDGSPRAPFCMMGACFECRVEIDGTPGVQACMTLVREGMRIVVPDTAETVQDP